MGALISRHRLYVGLAAQGEGHTPRPPHDHRGGDARRRRAAGRRRRRTVAGRPSSVARASEARHRGPSAVTETPSSTTVSAAPAGRAARRREPRDRRLRSDRAVVKQACSHRGPPLLPARRRRLRLHRPGALSDLAPATPCRGLDHHRGVHQERLSAAGRAHLDTVAQAPRSGARLSAREALVQRQDPDRLPEHRLLRPERLRHRDGGAHVLRHHAGA